MRPLTPSEIHALRDRLNWSARQLGSFLDRSHQTIYNWESGSTRPDECVQAILQALNENLERRMNHQPGSSVSDWIDRLEEEGLRFFLQQLMHSHSGREKICAELVRKSEKNGCLVVDTPSDKPHIYVVPLTEDGLQTFLDRLVRCGKEELLSDPDSSLLEKLQPASP